MAVKLLSKPIFMNTLLAVLKGIITLLTYSFTEHDLISIMAIKVQHPSHAAVYARVQKTN